MKNTTLFASALAVAFVAQAALAASPMSQSKLDSLGLSSMTVAGDVEGEAVRGQGFGASSFTFTVGIAGIPGFPTATATGTQSNVFGQDPQSLNSVSSGGTGFGGFTDNTAPNFSTFVSTPITVNAAFGGATAVSSIQGFTFGNGR